MTMLIARQISKMSFSKLSVFFLLFFFFSLFQAPAFADKKSYIVYLGSHAHGPEVSAADLDRVTDSHYDLLGSFLGSYQRAKDAIIYSYKRHINGFAAHLDEEEAADIAEHPKVVSVFLNQGRKLHTTHSWEFMLLEKEGVIQPSSLWKKARFGEDTIIATLDSGVWPKAESFSDEGLGPIPSKWKGFCENNTSDGVPCNRKLIGARYFNKGYAAYTNISGSLNSTFETAVDHDGHGTHTLSTAGGNFVAGANVFGFGNGTAKGGSPKARVAAYKVCWPTADADLECFDADIIAAFDEAIHDGVDVLSVSLGGGTVDYLEDGLSIGAFHAFKNGIVVVCSAGNSGPYLATVTNVSPWMITVGASTLDREFEAFVELRNGMRFTGKSMSKPLPEDRFYPLISAAQAKAANASIDLALLCMEGTLDPEKVKGKILACLRGVTGRLDKGKQAALAGAVGMILCNAELDGNETVADPYALPASHIDYADGVALFAYINSTDDPLAFITPPTAELYTKPAPFMASFSSRGPNIITPEILKPDITAPGVNIIAAFSEAKGVTEEPAGPFAMMSGTSMACPHVSGVAGLLKTLHPDWSPSAIRSAIMTTARTRDNTVNPMLDGSFVKATPFHYGAGHIRPNRAMDPGLVYDLTADDYLDFLCYLGYNQTSIQLFAGAPYKCPKVTTLLDFNYPSITVPELFGSVTVTRKLKNVGSPGTYAARLRPPTGISVHVDPTMLTFDQIGEEKSFKLTLQANKGHGMPSNYVFGGLTWSDGKHYVRSPIVVANAASFCSN